ncbi:hypothetical protein NC652_009910 [Populus alba x Populus x berolinensis]|nr:hypothetical protein NC652_009910 [Populus alba x Populus x berolinensis]
MTEERQKAIWAIYAWGTRMDEMVDGPNTVYMATSFLDRWEERLQDIFDGRPYDMLDAALTDTVSNFCLDIKSSTFTATMLLEQLGIRIMTVPVMGIAPESSVSTKSIYNAAIHFGIANQLTNILRDVGEDPSQWRIYLPQDELEQFGLSDEDVFARKIWSSLLLYQNILDAIEDNDYDNLTKRASVGKTKKLIILSHAYKKAQSVALRGRVYLPQDELAQFGLRDKDVFARKVTDGWRELMKEQITRARFYFNLAEEGASQLEKASRWPVWSSLLIYRKILDAIEDNDYDNFTKRAFVGRTKKLLTLPLAYSKAQPMSSLIFQ